VRITVSAASSEMIHRGDIFEFQGKFVKVLKLQTAEDSLEVRPLRWYERILFRVERILWMR
jgi:hypothetical protein